MKPFLRHWCRTKIVCTIGPATGSETMVRKLIRAGMDVARLNMSHGTPEEHAAYINLIRSVARDMGTTIAILLDLPGPKHRVGKLQGGKARLHQGAAVTLTDEPVEGHAGLIPVTLPGLSAGLVPGRTILLDDGALQIKVTAVNGREVQGRVTAGGLLVQGRGVVVPGMPNPGPFVSTELQQLLIFAARQQPDYIALSFVSRARDVNDARKVLREAGADIPIISKIERSDALKVFDSILAASDAIMVARGDLGVEIPLERVPLAQKRIIRKCNRVGKPVITATEMLQTMVAAQRPVRAEVTDVANAIFDGTDAVMLSAETSIGKYPIQAVKMMDRICRETEKDLPYESALTQRKPLVDTATEELIGYNACLTAHNLSAKAIVAFTQSGNTARRVSKYRPRPPILAVTPGDICGRLVLLWGVYPIRSRVTTSTTELFATAARLAKETGLARPGDRIVITGGIPFGESGSTNMLKVETVT
jgi:pyruvate kinase